MGIKTQYKGYKAFQYLEPGYDYRQFELSKEVGRVEEYVITLDAEQEERAGRIARDCVCISLHDHPVMFPEDMGEVFDYVREGKWFAAYEGLSHSYLDCVFDNLMDGMATITSKGGWKWEDVIFDMGMRLCDLAHQDFVIRCEKVDHIIQAHREGRIALVPCIEGAAPIENELDRIDILYGLGVRVLGVTYSESNGLGSGLKEEKDGGLTSFGVKAVERMNKVGMAVDVAHCGPQTSLDVIEASSKPIFITHVGAKGLWNSKRMAAEEVLSACAQKGGVIGIEAAPHTTLTVRHPDHSIESYMEHFQYMVNLVGIDHVGFGPDTLYGDHVALHEAYAAHMSVQGTQEGSCAFEKVPYVKGIENPTEASKNIVRWLVRNNYTDEDIEKVLGGNILRVLGEVWV